MLAPRAMPVDAPFGLRQLRRVGGQRFVLRRLARGAGFDLDRASGPAARRRESPASPRRSVVVSSGPIGTTVAEIIGPASSALTTRMIVTPVSAIAGDHGAMNRRGAAVAGQQRRVHVDQAEARRRQQPVGKNLAVGGDHADVGVERRQLLLELILREARRLQHRQAAARRASDLTGPSDTCWPRPRGPVGLRDDAGDRVRRVDQVFQRRHREAGRAEEGHAQRHQRFTTCRPSPAS